MSADADPGPGPGLSSIESGAVAVDDRQRDVALDGCRWGELMRLVMAEEKVEVPWEAGLSFVAAEEMAALNAAHRGVDRPTDVLAFGADDGSALRAPDEPRLVGDVVICPSVAAANAALRARRVDDELALLVVHGALHLLGYDHLVDHDAEQMESREQQLLAAAWALDEPVGTSALDVGDSVIATAWAPDEPVGTSADTA